MAVEPRRLCGWRRVGGLYLCGSYVSVSCDRLPYPLETCPVCGGGIKVSRGFTRINPYQLFGNHNGCKDQLRPCFMCDPRDEVAFIMGVGEKFYKTPGDFLEEAHRLGVSKRIPFIPKELELGKTVIYLAHPKAIEVKEPVALQQAMSILEESETKQPRLLETEKVEKRLGIFTAFIPQRIEKLVWQSEATPEELEKLEKRGIKPVIVPDGDKDHA
jgi:hypothetical protein